MMLKRGGAAPVDLQALQRSVAAQLKPPYQTLLKRGKEPVAAYAAIYERAVVLLAKATRVSKEKTRFEARDLLQEIMKEVSR